MRTFARPQRLLFVLLAVTLLGGGSDAASADEHQAEHLSLSLLSDVRTLAPGASFRVGVRMRMKEGWSTYWKEPGDSGLAPTFEWSLPAGFEIDSASWPLPEWHEVEGIRTMIYEPEALIVFRVRAPKGVPAVANLSVRVDWLVCHDVKGCLPGHAAVSLRLLRSTGDEAGSSDDAGMFDRHQASAPRPMPKAWQLSPDRRFLRLEGEGPWTDEGAVFDFFPEDFEAFDRSTELLHERSEGGVTLRLPFVQTEGRVPDTFRGVLAIRAGGKRLGYAVGWSRRAE